MVPDSEHLTVVATQTKKAQQNSCSFSPAAHIKGRMSDLPDTELLERFARNKSKGWLD
jgi:hypothetical protein